MHNGQTPMTLADKKDLRLVRAWADILESRSGRDFEGNRSKYTNYTIHAGLFMGI